MIHWAREQYLIIVSLIGLIAVQRSAHQHSACLGRLFRVTPCVTHTSSSFAVRPTSSFAVTRTSESPFAVTCTSSSSAVTSIFFCGDLRLDMCCVSADISSVGVAGCAHCAVSADARSGWVLCLQTPMRAGCCEVLCLQTPAGAGCCVCRHSCGLALPDADMRCVHPGSLPDIFAACP